jgi:hypothetical protein
VWGSSFAPPNHLAPRLAAARRTPTSSTRCDSGYRGGGGGGGGGRGPEARRRRNQEAEDFYSSPRKQSAPFDMQLLIRSYAFPAMGLLLVAATVAPLVGALALSAVGVGLAVATAATVLSISWLLVLPLVGFVGIPLIFASGLLTKLVASTLVVAAMLGAGLLLGASIAGRLTFGGGGRGSSGASAGPSEASSVIDVEADEVEAWRVEEAADAARRADELRAFDELLRRRDRFKQGGGLP